MKPTAVSVADLVMQLPVSRGNSRKGLCYADVLTLVPSVSSPAYRLSFMTLAYCEVNVSDVLCVLPDEV